MDEVLAAVIQLYTEQIVYEKTIYIHYSGAPVSMGTWGLVHTKFYLPP